jgi:delta 1-pyrroline-5-carboxylate dehydrogenase
MTLTIKGHVAIITAFNFPVAVYFWNAALSMVAGNTHIWKPQESVSLVAVAVTKLVEGVLIESGYPPAIASVRVRLRVRVPFRVRVRVRIRVRVRVRVRVKVKVRVRVYFALTLTLTLTVNLTLTITHSLIKLLCGDASVGESLTKDPRIELVSFTGKY